MRHRIGAIEISPEGLLLLTSGLVLGLYFHCTRVTALSDHGQRLLGGLASLRSCQLPILPKGNHSALADVVVVGKTEG